MRCHDCGVERDGLHKHHIVPKSLGGSNDPSNLVRLCANCHEDRHHGSVGGLLRGKNSQTAAAKAKRTATIRRLWADPAFRQRMHEKLHSPEARAKRHATMERWRAVPENRAKITAIMREIASRPERNAKISATNKRIGRVPPRPADPVASAAHARQFLDTPEARANWEASMERVRADPKVKAKRAASMHDRWQDPEYRQTVLEARGQGGERCRRGHPFDDGNTQIDSRGRRYCRTCHADATRASWLRRHPDSVARGPYRKVAGKVGP